MLQLLPDLVFPITSKQADALLSNMVKLNLLEAHLTERQQRALGLMFHIFDTWTKSGGRIDYRGLDGHRRLVDDAMSFAGRGMGNRIGDLEACHLALDFSDCQLRLRGAGLPLISSDVNTLLNECRDLCEYSVEDEKRTGLLLDYLGKRRLV